MRRGLIAILLLLFTVQVRGLGQSPGPATVVKVGSPATKDEALENQVSEFVQNEMSMDRVAAMSVVVVRKGKVLLACGYGYAEPRMQTSATASTLYEIGSITKQFTAAAAMMLVEQGRLGLDDPITKYLGSLPPDWAGITVRHLLTHTSGIAEFTELPELRGRFKQGELIAPAEVLKLVASKPLGSRPGEKFTYCNTGYHLLGLIIERASGQPYGDFMATHIFKPLGMTSTRVSDQRPLNTLAQGFMQPGIAVGPLRGYSAGGIVSTAEDMARWAVAFDQGQFVKKESVERMWTQCTLNDGRRITYGFGWIVEVDNATGNSFVGHAGGTFGFSSFITRLPSEQLTVIVLTNAGYGYTRFYAHGITAICAPWFRETWLKDESEFRQKHHRGSDEFELYLKKAGVSTNMN